MRYFLLCVGLLCSLLVACEKPVEQQNTERPVITLTSDAVVMVNSYGGDVEITYSIANAISGVNIEVSCSADWVRVSPNTEFGRIIVNIAPNETEQSRDTTVALNYNGSKSFVRIMQNGVGDDIPELTLLSDSEVNIDRNRQRIRIEYELVNPTLDGFIYVIAREEWIASINTENSGYVELTILANDSGAERLCDITVGYDGCSFHVLLTQSAGGDIVFVADNLAGYYYGDQFSPGVGNYWIILSDNGFNEYGSMMPNSTYYRIDAYAPIYTGSNVMVDIPVGTYTLDNSNSCAEWSIAAEASELRITDIGGGTIEQKSYESATLVVESDKITLDVVIDGEPHRVVYQGAAVLRDEQDAKVVYSTLTDDYTATLDNHYLLFDNYGDYYEYGYQNWMFVIKPYSGVGDCFQLDIISGFADAESGFAGDYVGSDVLAPSSFIPGWLAGNVLYGSWFFTTDEEQLAPFRKGEMSVRDNGDGTMSVDIEVFDDRGYKITASWSGSAEALTRNSLVYDDIRHHASQVYTSNHMCK